jgi:hypothetical protein
MFIIWRFGQEKQLFWWSFSVGDLLIRGYIAHAIGTLLLWPGNRVCFMGLLLRSGLSLLRHRGL